MAPQTTVKLTYEDFAQIPDDGRRHEIIDGEHYVNPAPNIRHQLVSMQLVLALGRFVSDHHVGRVFHAPCDVLLGANDIVEPDIIFVSNANAHILTEPNIKGVPDLLVEILSTNDSYDRKTKYRLYERYGVPEYWIADPFDNLIEVFRLRAGKFERLPLADTITTPLLPGFSLAVRDLFVDL